eukprot:m.635705 g.635705  ORF g.635705 m.635705 type:complete len:71 (+) comp22587_c0_seq11:3755-3967(+)
MVQYPWEHCPYPVVANFKGCTLCGVWILAPAPRGGFQPTTQQLHWLHYLTVVSKRLPAIPELISSSPMQS